MDNITFLIFILKNYDIFPKELVYLISKLCFDLIPININLKDQTILQIGNKFYSNNNLTNINCLQNLSNKINISKIIINNKRIYFINNNNFELLRVINDTIELKFENIKYVSCGKNAIGIIATNGDLYMNGRNIPSKKLDSIYAGFTKMNFINVKHINCEYYHCVVIAENGDLYIWYLTEYEYDSSRKIGEEFIYSVCGNNFAMAINKHGEAFGFGYAEQFGYKNDHECDKKLYKIQINEPISTISCGCYHAIILTTNGNLYGWGTNGNGQLGIANMIDTSNPVKICSDVKMVECGDYNTMFVKNNNDVYVCGNNDLNSLLIANDKKRIFTPTKLKL